MCVVFGVPANAGAHVIAPSVRLRCTDCHDRSMRTTAELQASMSTAECSVAVGMCNESFRLPLWDAFCEVQVGFACVLDLERGKGSGGLRIYLS